MTENTTVARKEAAPMCPPETTWGGAYYTPRVDIFETPEELVVACDVPGVKPADLELRFENGELFLRGKVHPRQYPEVFSLNEYGVGDFFRSFTINGAFDPSKITAQFKLGVLTVHLPKREEVKPKRIAIKAE
jgi:HSP20 family protein